VAGTVLLIDDEPDMGDLVSEWLELLGTQVTRAERFEDALAAAIHERPRAILLDISLGAEDGLDLLPRLLQAPALAQVPVVVFSVHVSKRREALKLGAVAFVPKPFEGADLLAAVGPYLE
jgi:CheY-like chemotaxis protein